MMRGTALSSCRTRTSSSHPPLHTLHTLHTLHSLHPPPSTILFTLCSSHTLTRRGCRTAIPSLDTKPSGNPFADADDGDDDDPFSNPFAGAGEGEDEEDLASPFADSPRSAKTTTTTKTTKTTTTSKRSGGGTYGRKRQPADDIASPFDSDSDTGGGGGGGGGGNPFARPEGSKKGQTSSSRVKAEPVRKEVVRKEVVEDEDEVEYSYYTDEDEDGGNGMGASPRGGGEKQGKQGKQGKGVGGGGFRSPGSVRGEHNVSGLSSVDGGGLEGQDEGAPVGLETLPMETIPEGYEGRRISVDPLPGTYESSEEGVGESRSVTKKLGRKLGSSLGLFKHTAYNVRTEQHSRVIEVERRYKHFEWLYNSLAGAYSYRLVPTLPEKKFFGRFAKDFIARRRSGLEAFLNFVANHPILCRSVSLELFLTTMDGKEWEDIMGGKSSHPTSEVGNALGLPPDGVEPYLVPAHRIRAEAMSAKVSGYQEFIKAAQKTSARREGRIREDVEDMRLFADSLHGALDDSHQPVAHSASSLIHAGIWVRDVDRELDRYSEEVTSDVWAYQGLLSTAMGISCGMAKAVAARDAQAAAIQALSNAAATARSKALQAPDDVAAEAAARSLEAELVEARAEGRLALYCVLQEWKIFYEYQPQVVTQVMEQYVVGNSSLPERVRGVWFDAVSHE